MHYNLTGYKFRNLNLKEGNRASERIRAIKYIHFPIIPQEDYTKSLMYLAFRFSKHHFNQHLLSRALVCGMVSQKTTKEIKIEVYYLQVLEEIHHTPWGQGHLEGQGWSRQGVSRPGHTPFWECFEVQGQGWMVSLPRSRALVSCLGGFIKGLRWGRCWKAGNLHLLVTTGCFLGF